MDTRNVKRIAVQCYSSKPNIKLRNYIIQYWRRVTRYFARNGIALAAPSLLQTLTRERNSTEKKKRERVDNREDAELNEKKKKEETQEGETWAHAQQTSRFFFVPLPRFFPDLILAHCCIINVCTIPSNTDRVSDFKFTLNDGVTND